MQKKTLLFAMGAHNLSETNRMVEIAKGVVRHPEASKVFDVHFISYGGEFERLIENENFPMTKMEPRITAEKIKHLYQVDRVEKFAPAFSNDELTERTKNEINCLKAIRPVAVITGSNLSTPVTCRVLKIPVVWVIQSTWLPENIKATNNNILYNILYGFGVRFAKFWMKLAYINTVNKTAKIFGVPGYNSISDLCRGDITLFAEPPQFSGAPLPPGYYFIGTLLPRNQFTIPGELTGVPRDKPLIYFAMGSSGTPAIVAKIIESFEGKPYRVIAPVKFQLKSVRDVRIPSNVTVTDWLPDLQVNKMADLAVIHGGIGTVLTAAMAGRPVVGVAMQPEQYANIACLEQLGFAKQVPKSKNPSKAIHAAIKSLLNDNAAKEKALAFSKLIADWDDGPKVAADLLLERYGS